MDLETLENYPLHWAGYQSECNNCGKIYSLFTQNDNSPEYYTEVYVKCDCGGVSYFELPVN